MRHDEVSVELVARDTVIVPLDTGQVRAAMTAYQDGLKSILDDEDYQHFKDKKTGESRKFPKRSAWRKIAYWFNLDLELLSEDVTRDPQGNPIRAKVKARAIHPNRRHADGDGACSIKERGFGKPEHDIPATAATRAMNRAISNLVGMGEVSAEEVDDLEDPQLYGPPALKAHVNDAIRAAQILCDDEQAATTLMLRLENDAGGYLPKIVARALMLVAAHRPAPVGLPPTEGGTGETMVGGETTQPTHK